MEFDLDKTISILRRTPDTLRSLLADLPEDWTAHNYGPGTWTPHQVIGHLIWGERTDWLPRAKWILSKGESAAFAPFDRDGHLGLCREKSLAELLDIFSAERATGLEALNKLGITPESLRRAGVHPALGRVTLAQLLATWPVHDLNHIAQVCKGMAFQHAGAVGPWQAYLSILAPPNPR